MKKYFVGIYGVGKENELDEYKFWFNSYDLALAATEVLSNLSSKTDYEVTRPINLTGDTYKIEIFDDMSEQIGFIKNFSRNALSNNRFLIKNEAKEKAGLEKFKDYTHIIIPTHYKVTSCTEHSKITVGRYFEQAVANEHANKINDACNYESAKVEKIQKMRLTVFNSLKNWQEVVSKNKTQLKELQTELGLV